MESPVQFDVDDTSPSISYSPFGDTFTTPDLSAGWNPYYNLSGFIHSIGEVGNGTSLHITSLNGASLALQWRGTGIQLLGNVTLASYALTVDGESVPTPVEQDTNILANIQGLEDDTHNITLTARIPPGQNPPNSSMLVFDTAIIMSSPIPVSSNVSFPSQKLNDSDIAFLGHWSFQTVPSGSSFHKSSTAGDRAIMSFTGTAFLIQGITSPDAGNYTVTLDNVTSSLLSGRSSFTAYDSLLFYASGLDPEATHSVEVRNLGGDLSLLVDGVSTFSPSNLPPTTTPSSIPSPLTETSTMSFAEGTLAAFILAGILAFTLFTGLLFYFLFYRPRRQRQRRMVNDRLEQSPKEQEAGMILDIAPNGDGHYIKDLDLEEEEVSPVEHRHYSGRSGFARWRREAMHGSLGGVSLPLHFRHSDSGDGKSRHNNEDRPASARSDPPSSESSRKRKARAKSKGKARQITGRSWSPSFTLELPMQRARSSSGDNNFNRIISTGGMSSFVAADPSPQKTRNPEPPSYAASVSNRDSIRNSNSDPSLGIPSGPRSVTHSLANNSYPRIHYRENSNGFLLHEGEPNSDQDSPNAEHPPHQLSAPEAIPMRPLTRYDGGSLTTDDDPSIVEPRAMREVLRTLSPRTSEAPQRQSQRRHTVVETTQLPVAFPAQMLLEEEEPIQNQAQTRRSKSLPRTPSSDDDLVEVREGVFLSVRETSPFRVDFDSRSIRVPTVSGDTTDAPYFTAPSGSKKPSRKSSGSSNLADRSSAPPRMPEFVQGMSTLPFRLTSMTFGTTPPPPPKLSSSGHSDGVTSFLDLTSSREGSMKSHSIRTGTAGSDQDRPFDENRLSVPGIIEPKSRWSNTTVPSVATNPAAPANESSGESQMMSRSEARSTTDSSTFPIQVQVNIPPSPHHIMDSYPQRRSRASGLTQSGDLLHVHPPMENLESPTDSIPMSVSDLHFRHSDSEENPSSRRTTEGSTAHPPLPGSPSADEFRPRPFDPSILVSRVLGMPPLASPSTTARPGGHSRSASAAAPPSLNSFPSSRPGPDQSNEHLTRSETSGQTFS
ncbi:hypothetical protein GALMADRAFT_130366 [Galerina marginata CBS 339.88]|uniref:Uncharacterized protein n=1 Tax=Galerina marginata (strain CBS 339.88) TaxID=685588 RepID=A0A067SLD5_GALM3|nr:hypothetical protein GALMADRAFT_130366 [Galerina marginata CBS 339.88]